MKTKILLSSLALAAAMLSPATAQTVQPKARPSHGDLIKKRKANQPKITQHDNPQPIFKPAKRSLINSSTLLSDGTYWTLVPKGSVILIPDTQKKKIVTAPKGKLIEWKKFLTRNSSWLQTFAVDMKQAQGKEYLNKEKLQTLQTLNKVVVATCAAGPISVSKNAFPKEESQTKTPK